MIDNLLMELRLWLWVNTVSALMQVFSRAGNIISAAILWLNDFSRSFDHVNFSDMFHESLNVWQRRLIASSANAVAPQAVINNWLILRGHLGEVSLHASITVRYRMLKSVAWILELIVTFIPGTFENLYKSRE